MPNQPAPKPESFEDAKVCYASMANVSVEDGSRLYELCSEGIFENLVAYEHCWGFFIYLDACLSTNSEGFVDSLHQSGYSGEFIQLMTDARLSGFDHLYLRRDVKPAHDRPVFDWSSAPFGQELEF